MNEEYDSTPSAEYVAVAVNSAFWPLAILSISFAIVLIWQLTNIIEQRSNVKQNRERMENAFTQSAPQNEQLLAQSRAVQGKLQALVTDLLALAHSGDADAKAIVDKYKIQQQAPAPGAAAAASPAVSP